MKPNLTIRLSVLVSLILVMALPENVYSQSFEQARNFAFNGERAKAREICRALLSNGFDSDAALLLGRTYAWDGNYDSARVVFNEVLLKNPQNMEVLDAFSDVEYWSGNYVEAIGYCNRSLEKNPANEAMILKKAKILHSGEKYAEAVKTLDDFNSAFPGRAEIMRKLQEYRPDVLKNTVQLSYTYDSFDKDFHRDPWQIAALSYGRKTRFGSLIFRTNLAKRYGNSGFQYEVDAYPKISENNYGYLNYGFSKCPVFPKNRFGFEWYHNFPASFEGSAGMRILFFGGSSVNIYTATIGKYAGSYWASLRTFVTPSSSGTSVSGLLQVRRYFSDPEDYIGLRLGYGVSPDDNRNLIDSGQKLSLKTRSIRLEYNHIINHIWIIKTGAVWGNEELQQKNYSGYYTFDISISRLF
jgi:YaiO family outer membrane protein